MKPDDRLRPRGKRIKEKLREKLSTILIVAGIVVILFPFATEGYGYFSSLQMMKAWDKQAASQKQQAEKVRKNQDRLISLGKLPEEEAIIGGSLAKKTSSKKKDQLILKPFPKTKITIPKIGVDQVVLEGSGPETLQFGPGHYIATANPGDKGNCGIAGHRVTYTHPFNRLDELAKGDMIILETVDYIYEYQVENMMVTDPSDVSNLQPTTDPRVTLTTCNPKYSAKTRLNVVGVLVNSKPQHVSIVRTVKEIFSDKKKEVKKPRGSRTYEELIRDLKKARGAIKKDQLDVNAYIELSRTALELDRYAEAYQALKKAELIEPVSPDILELHAAFNAKKAFLQNKIEADRTDVIGKDDPMLYLELGRFYYETDDFQNAADVFRRATDIYPYIVDAFVYEGKACEKLGNDDLAVESYRRALVYDPTSSDASDGIKRIQNKKPANVSDINRLHYELRPQ